MVRKILKEDINTAFRPFVVRLGVGDSLDPAILSRLARLRDYLGQSDATTPDHDLNDEFSELGLKEQGWKSLQVFNSLGREIDLKQVGRGVDDWESGSVRAAEVPFRSLSSRPDAPASSHSREKASRLVKDFWSRVLSRGIDGMQAAIVNDVTGVEPESAKAEPAVAETVVIKRKDARRQVKAFYSAVLKRALDRLQHSIGEDMSPDGDSETHPMPSS